MAAEAFIFVTVVWQVSITWGLSKPILLISNNSHGGRENVQGGAAYQLQGFKDEVFEVNPTTWLMLKLPTAQAGLRNSHWKHNKILRPVGSPALKPWKQQNRKGNGHIDIATIVLVPELKSSKNYFGGLWGDGSLKNTSVVISNNTFNISIPKYNRIHVLAASKRYFTVLWGHSGLKMTTEQSHRGNRWSKIWTQRPQLPMFPCFSGL